MRKHCRIGDNDLSTTRNKRRGGRLHARLAPAGSVPSVRSLVARGGERHFGHASATFSVDFWNSATISRANQKYVNWSSGTFELMPSRYHRRARRMAGRMSNSDSRSIPWTIFCVKERLGVFVLDRLTPHQHGSHCRTSGCLDDLPYTMPLKPRPVVNASMFMQSAK